MVVTDTLKQIEALLKQAIKEVRQSPTPLPKGASNRVIKLQEQIVQLRNEAVVLHRDQGHSLIEVSHAFDISPSRVSQIARGIKTPKGRRIHLRK